jgi:hypothetical protein
MAALDLLSAVLAALAAISAFTYVALFLFDRYCPEQDLKVRVRAARSAARPRGLLTCRSARRARCAATASTCRRSTARRGRW